MNNFSRRGFLKSILAAPACIAAPVCVAASEQECGAKHHLAGKRLPAWKPGEFQVHFIYTGVAESMFWIMPDGTTKCEMQTASRRLPRRISGSFFSILFINVPPEK